MHCLFLKVPQILCCVEPKSAPQVQIVYILDQVRALEREMLKRIEDSGLEIQPQILIVTRLIPEAQGTTCDQRIEEINGTRYARILRVPFRAKDGRVVPHWMSRCPLQCYGMTKPTVASVLGRGFAQKLRSQCPGQHLQAGRPGAMHAKPLQASHRGREMAESAAKAA